MVIFALASELAPCSDPAHAGDVVSVMATAAVRVHLVTASKTLLMREGWLLLVTLVVGGLTLYPLVDVQGTRTTSRNPEAKAVLMVNDFLS